jgi:hypothetical protein
VITGAFVSFWLVSPVPVGVGVGILIVIFLALRLVTFRCPECQSPLQRRKEQRSYYCDCVQCHVTWHVGDEAQGYDD